jgi:hypothetical protein
LGEEKTGGVIVLNGRAKLPLCFFAGELNDVARFLRFKNKAKRQLRPDHQYFSGEK